MQTQGRHSKPPEQASRHVNKTAVGATAVLALAVALSAFSITNQQASTRAGGAVEQTNSEQTRATNVLDGRAAELGNLRVDVGGWLPYWEWRRKANPAAKNIVTSASSFETSIEGTGTNLILKAPSSIQGWEPARQRWAAKTASTWLSVTDGTSAGTLAQTLQDSRTRAKLTTQLTQAVTNSNFTGLDLDLEGFAYRDGSASWKATAPAWIDFIAELKAALEAGNKQLSVTTPPIYNGKKDRSSGYWVYSWPEIAPHIDRLRIMAYDYSYTHAGPIGPLNWADSILAYATSVVEPSKIELGVASYGRNWVTSVTGTCPAGANTRRTTLNMTSGTEIARLRGAQVTYNTTYAEATFSYRMIYSENGKTCTVNRTAWYPTAESIAARAQLAAKHKIAGIYVWTLGSLNNAAWKALKSSQASR